MTANGWLDRTLDLLPKSFVESKTTEIQSWEVRSILAMLAVTAASASIKGWQALATDWLGIAERTRTACIQSNLVFSLASDPVFDDPNWIATWSNPLAREILGDMDADYYQVWHLSFYSAARFLHSPDGFIDERFQSDCLCIPRPKEDVAVIEVALAALATIVTISAGSLLALQLTRPTKEFIQVRELAKEHEWARILCRRGPRLADRRIWSVKGAWNGSVFENTGSEFDVMSDACRRIAEVTDCECIEPKVGTAFDDGSMESTGSHTNSWVLKINSVGLCSDSSVFQPAIVETSSSDRLALHLTADHRLSQRCVELLCESTCKDAGDLRQDILDAVRDAARSENEYAEWLRLITHKSPEQDLTLLDPSVGSELNEKLMSRQNDVWSSSKATVSKVICPGLVRNEEVLVRALVQATQD